MMAVDDLRVRCDEAGCTRVFEPDAMTETNAEARFVAIECGWQSVSRDGVRRDYCPRHLRPDTSPSARELRDEIGHPPRSRR